MELLAMIAPHGGNNLAAIPMAPRRYEQNLSNLLPAPSNRSHQETRNTEMAQQLLNHRLCDGGCKKQHQPCGAFKKRNQL